MVREILDYKVYLNREENVRITEIRFFDCIEDTVDDVFVQNLTFLEKTEHAVTGARVNQWALFEHFCSFNGG